MTTNRLRLRTHLAERTNTAALFDGRVTGQVVDLDICGPKAVAQGFKPLVRDNAFEVSEIPLMTYLQAHEAGVPLIMLPATMFGRLQHNMLAVRRDAGISQPKDLEGRRVGIRSNSVTTVVWMRGILQHQYGVDLDAITWVAHEDPHVAGVVDPAGVERISLNGRTHDELLAAGEHFDAAILGFEVKDHAELKTLFADPAAEALAWSQRFGTGQVNHLFAVSKNVAADHPAAVRDIYRMLEEAKFLGPVTELGVDALPFGLEAVRRSVELGVQYAWEQGLIRKRPSVEELFVPGF